MVGASRRAMTGLLGALLVAACAQELSPAEPDPGGGGYASEADRKKALALGAADYLVKPVQPELLLRSLRRWLDAPPR